MDVASPSASAAPAPVEAAAPATQTSDPPPVPPLEALAGIMQGTIWSALSSASQQLHRWTPGKPANTPFMHQAALCEASASPAHGLEEIRSVPSPDMPFMSQQPGPQRIQQQSSDGQTRQWLQPRLSRLGSRCSDALDRFKAAGGRQLDGLQASAQQLMPWPQLQVQRQSALRVRVLSCRLRWPPVQQPDLELNLTNM